MINKPFFTLGTGRCGTTLMTKILGAHPRVASFNETRLIFGSSWSLTGWEKGRESPDVFDTILGIHWADKLPKKVVDPFGLMSDPEGFFSKDRLQSTWQRCVQLEVGRRAIVRRFAESILGGWAIINGRSIWAEKQPNMVLQGDGVFSYWKNARVLFMLRDPQDTWKSMSTKHWGPKTPDEFCKLWKRTMDKHAEQGGTVICFERLVAAPMQVVSTLFGMIDEVVAGSPVLESTIRRASLLIKKDFANIGCAVEPVPVIEEHCRASYDKLAAMSL